MEPIIAVRVQSFCEYEPDNQTQAQECSGITKQAQEGSTSLDRRIYVLDFRNFRPTNLILGSIFWGQQVHASPFRYNNIIIDYLITLSWKTKLYILNFERLNILKEWVGGIVVPSRQVRWTIIQPMLSDYEHLQIYTPPMLTFSRITQYRVTCEPHVFPGRNHWDWWKVSVIWKCHAMGTTLGLLMDIW